MLSEQYLHYIWFHRLFFPEQKTIDGQSIEILNTGIQNNDEGPDAFNAKIKIDGITWAGNVEIHKKSSDWNKHKHSNNKHYDNTILHVVAEYDEEIIHRNGATIPTIVLNINEKLISQYSDMMNSTIDIRCATYLPQVDPIHKSITIEKMAIERMRRKAETVEDIARKYKGNMEQTFFIMLCRSFGFSLNADAMQMMAMSFPHNILFKIGDNLQQVEALMLGQAGFLDVKANDEYTTLLQREYTHLKAKYELTSIPQGLFKMLRLRPQNFPTIRIAQLAALLFKHKQLYTDIITTESTDTLRSMLQSTASNYWDTHYTLGKRQDKETKKTIAKKSLDTMIINAVIPTLFYYSKQWDKIEYSLRATTILEKLEAENNHITKLFSNYGFQNDNALQSQGIIQNYKEYCKQKQCLHCPMCYQVMKDSSSKKSKW